MIGWPILITGTVFFLVGMLGGVIYSPGSHPSPTAWEVAVILGAALMLAGATICFFEPRKSPDDP